MLTNKLYGVRENRTLHKIHRGTISVYHAKAVYDIRRFAFPSRSQDF
jgi:hypothetical protein